MGYDIMSQKVLKVIQSNITLMAEGDFSEYCELEKVFKRAQTLRKHIAQMYEWMLNHPQSLAVDNKKNEYWVMPVSDLIAKYGGQNETWQSHIIIMCLLGLIRRIRPTNRSRISQIKKAYAASVEAKRRAMSFFVPVVFDEQTLKNADKEAAEMIRLNMSLGHITKTDIIRNYGKKRADEIYVDGRTQSCEEAYVYGLMKAITESHVDQNGYALVDMVKQEAIKRLKDDCGSDQDKLNRYPRYIDKWMKRKRDMLQESGYEYRQQTKTEHVNYGITESCWIIARKQ